MYNTGCEAFTDVPGELFKDLLGQVRNKTSVHRHTEVYMLPAIQCVVEEESASITKQCSSIVHAQISRTNAKIIVAMGSTAIQSLGIKGSIDSLRGRETPITLGGKPYTCIPTYSPGALMRKEKSGLTKTFLLDITKALDLSLPHPRILPTIAESTKDYMYAKNVPDALKILDEIKKTWKLDTIPVMAVDTETTGLATYREDFRMIACSFAWGENKAAAMLFDHRELAGDYKELIEPLKEVLAGPNKKIFHNYKYDWKVLTLANGMHVSNVVWDSQCGEYLLDENKAGHYGLKEITRNRVPKFTDYEKIIKKSMGGEDLLVKVSKKIAETKIRRSDSKERISVIRTIVNEKIAEVKIKSIGLKGVPKGEERNSLKIIVDIAKESRDEEKAKVAKEKRTYSRWSALLKRWGQRKKSLISKAKEATFEDIPVNEMLQYAAIDTACTREISLQQFSEINEEHPDLMNTMTDIMLPAAHALGRMEHEGTRVDKDYIREIGVKFEEVRRVSAIEIKDAIGRDVNLNSPKQLIELLTFDLGLKLVKKSRKTGDFSTDKDVLKSLESSHPVIPLIAKWKAANRSITEYVTKYLKMSEYDGKIHGNYNTTVAATGRLCIAKGTLISVLRKGTYNTVVHVPIEQVSIGDIVYCYDEYLDIHTRPVKWSGQTGHKKVVKVTCMHVLSNKPTYLELTPTHKIRKSDGVWVEACNLRKKDIILGMGNAGVEAKYSVVEVNDVDDKVDVYNLEIEEHSNFISNGINTKNSSSAPNLQNIPSKVLGINIKKIFIPDNDDEEFCDADYSGAEIRVLTAYAIDEVLIAVLKDGRNIHSFVASKVFKVSYDDMQNRGKIKDTDPARYQYLDDLRQTAKKMVFLTIYGGGAATLHEDLSKQDPNITVQMCEDYIRDFLAEFPIIEEYMRSIKSQIDRNGYVTTFFGRKRRFPLASLSWKLKNDSYREGINAPIQSTSSDLVVGTLIAIDNHREELGIKTRITVHDSFAFSYPKVNRDKIVPFLNYHAEQRIAEKFPWLPVPFIYEAGTGPSYGECDTFLK